jgi:Tfp pilus assembly protein PilW
MTNDQHRNLELQEQEALDRAIDAVATAQLFQHSQGFPARFGIQEAAVATGMSTSAIRRAIKAGKIQTTRHPITNAYEMSAEALIAAGYHLRATTAPAEAKPQSIESSAEVEYLRQRIKDLEEALAFERQRTLSADERLDRALQAIPRRLFTRKALKRGDA